jgi:hypothetical protein
VQVTTNENYVKRRALIGTLGTVIGFVVLGLGMYISIQQTGQGSPPVVNWVTLVPWFTLGIGIISLNIGKYYAMRYGGRPRVDQAIVQALKGVDHRYHLYNWVPTLPVEHLLVTPNAVIVLETRPFYGDVIHQGSRWTRPYNFGSIVQRFTDGGLGNPTTESQRSAAAVQEYLKERLGQSADGVSVLPMVVLTNSRLKLQLTDPDVPVVTMADLKAAVRRLKEGGKVPADIQRQVIRALEWGPATETESVSTRRGTWQQTQK